MYDIYIYIIQGQHGSGNHLTTPCRKKIPKHIPFGISEPSTVEAQGFMKVSNGLTDKRAVVTPCIFASLRGRHVSVQEGIIKTQQN